MLFSDAFPASPLRRIRNFVAFSALALVSVAHAGSSVILDPGGVEVCAAAGDQTQPRAVAAAGSSAIVVWRDTRRGASLFDVYATAIASGGGIVPGWPADGLALSANGTAGPPIPVPDGAGGALVLWRDSRDGGQIYGQRVSADGVVAPGWPADGRALTAVSGQTRVNTLLDAIPDGSGGAYFAWRQEPIIPPQGWAVCIGAYLTRIDSEGVPVAGWSSPGLYFSECNFLGPSDVFTWGRLRDEPGSGVMFVHGWGDFLDPMYHWSMWVRRISAGGVTISSKQIHKKSPSYGPNTGILAGDGVPDGAGGFLASWNDNSVSPGEFKQHFNAAGSPLWATVDTLSRTYQYLEPDGSGGAYFIGSRTNVSRLDVFRRTGTGGIPTGWISIGFTICQPLEIGPVARAWLGGDLVMTWADRRGASGFDIRVIGVQPEGGVGPGFDSDGSPVCEASGDQTLPSITVMSTGLALICWEDRRNGNADIRVSRIGPDVTGVSGPVDRGPNALIRSMLPNPARSHVRLGLNLRGSEPARLRVLDLAGRPVGRAVEVRPLAGSQEADFDLGDLPAGIFWLEVLHGPYRDSRRLIVVR